MTWGICPELRRKHWLGYKQRKWVLATLGLSTSKKKRHIIGKFRLNAVFWLIDSLLLYVWARIRVKLICPNIFYIRLKIVLICVVDIACFLGRFLTFSRAIQEKKKSWTCCNKKEKKITNNHPGKNSRVSDYTRTNCNLDLKKNVNWPKLLIITQGKTAGYAIIPGQIAIWIKKKM